MILFIFIKHVDLKVWNSKSNGAISKDKEAIEKKYASRRVIFKINYFTNRLSKT